MTLTPIFARLSSVRLLLLLLLLCGGATTVAQPNRQQSQKALSYGFVSPNTRDDLTLEQAIKGMHSPEESALLRKAVNLGCVVKSKVRVSRALGSWSDGAEQSLILRVKVDEPAIRYLLSRMGRDAQQKSVLYFHPGSTGTARIYTLKPRQNMRNLGTLANRLERAGIAFRTLMPVGKSTWVYVVDLNRELHAKVMTAAKRLRARVSSETGTAAFVGADQVSQAKTVFDQEIQNYETRNPNLPPTCDIQRTKVNQR
jgi:hypothetical protein